jgi:uroporphyrinogen-III decarboxylase
MEVEFEQLGWFPHGPRPRHGLALPAEAHEIAQGRERELPGRKIIPQIDGSTDIFRARRVIGDHCCPFGDVPSAMLAFGEEQEVTDYCRKLIDVAGGDGGFVLAAGCEIPPNARPENVKAMIEAATRYGRHC